MTASLGRVIAHLAEPSEVLPTGLVELINQNINPPTPVKPDEVYIRAMYVVSDQVNSFGGRFPVNEHERLAALLIDSPVMVGHRKDKLPVGRNFHAVMVEHNGGHWVKSYFYWLRSTDSADDLRENIDGGIYKECSVAFTFSLPECSICGRDIRLCKHEPLQAYEQNGVTRKCHFNYRRIERVLETSLVYRGAVPDTSVSKELDEPGAGQTEKTGFRRGGRLTRLRSLRQLGRDRKYLVVPRYEGIPLLAKVVQGKLMLSRLDGSTVRGEVASRFQPQTFQPCQPVRGFVVGYRGKDRCSEGQLARYLAGHSSDVSRLLFNVLPQRGIQRVAPVERKSPLDIRMIPYRVTSVAELDRKAREIMTSLGVNVWPLAEQDGFPDTTDTDGFYFHPDQTGSRPCDSYRLVLSSDDETVFLALHIDPDDDESAESWFRIACFDRNRLREGRRFVACRTEAPDRLPESQGTVCEGLVESLITKDNAFEMELDGYLSGRFLLRPIKLNDQFKHLFCQFRRQRLGGSKASPENAVAAIATGRGSQ